MATSKETRKCSRCGHPWNKHTAATGDGCTVRVYYARTGQLGFCTCRAFVERVK